MSRVDDLIKQWRQPYQELRAHQRASELSEALGQDRLDEAAALMTFHKEAWSEGYDAGLRAAYDHAATVVMTAAEKGTSARAPRPPDYTAVELARRMPVVVRPLERQERVCLGRLVQELEEAQLEVGMRPEVLSVLRAVLARFPAPAGERV